MAMMQRLMVTRRSQIEKVASPGCHSARFSQTMKNTPWIKFSVSAALGIIRKASE